MTIKGNALAAASWGNLVLSEHNRVVSSGNGHDSLCVFLVSSLSLISTAGGYGGLIQCYLGVVCRPVEETMEDTAEALLMKSLRLHA